MPLPLLLLAVALALPQAAGAATACLTGDAVLADRRALAALRAATAAACPCDSFAGGRARGRYQRCARTEMKAAQAAGTLRRECLREARRTNRGALCGTNRIACGQVDDDFALGCRLAAPQGRHACGSSRRFSETPCEADTHCSDVTLWTAGTCTDPRRAGPYGIGVRVLPLVKDSVAAPGTDRFLDTVVWYPTVPDSGVTDPTYQGVLDAPITLAGAPYPVLLFSHGSCGYALQSTFLLPLLASYGYVVAAPPHPGNTLQEFPACGLPAAQIASAQERPADMRFVLDELLAANADAGSPFFAALDPERVGMSGHSFGGLTTYLVMQQDARFRIAIPMAAAVIGSPQLTRPSLTLLGQIDSRVSNDAIRTAYANAAAPKLLVEIEHAGHYAFSDLCFPSSDCNPPATLTQPEAHELAQRFVLPFLERYLRGDASAEAFFTAPPHGVTVQRAP